jgi:uncharacterized protein YjiS (DUF1127 family)
MTATTLSNRAEASNFSFVEIAFRGLRRMRNRAAARQILLDFDDRMLRDVGLTRLDVMDGSF